MMLLAAFALAIQLQAASDEWCAIGDRTTRGEVFVAIAPAAPADTILRAAVCYVAGPQLPALGSYHGRLRFDSTAVRVLRAEKLSGGVRAENLAKRGVVDFAGASASGFESGPLLAVLLRVRPGYRPPLQLEIAEANAVTAGTLLPQLKIVGVVGSTATDSVMMAGLPTAGCSRQAAAGASQRPTLVRLLPASVPLDSLAVGAVVNIEIEGCGFDQDRNTVRLGSSTIAEVPSNSERTRVRFSLPAQLPTGGEVAPPRMGPGSYAVSVTTGLGTSNPLTLVVR